MTAFCPHARTAILGVKSASPRPTPPRFAELQKIREDGFREGVGNHREMGDSAFWTRKDHLHASSVDCEGVALKLIGHVNHPSQQLAERWGN
jgi:hypothetical protein